MHLQLGLWQPSRDLPGSALIIYLSRKIAVSACSISLTGPASKIHCSKRGCCCCGFAVHLDGCFDSSSHIRTRATNILPQSCSTKEACVLLCCLKSDPRLFGALSLLTHI